ncbi:MULTISPECIES: hypothetical protein [Methylomicrobium]|uniref:hypothetical protein n=1 Tax=Methylomicrobium TaxID=39773 RepID=UPI000B097E7E|nr:MULTISPECIES: hypothetical protein [Methylomicrobium]
MQPDHLPSIPVRKRPPFLNLRKAVSWGDSEAIAVFGYSPEEARYPAAELRIDIAIFVILSNPAYF